MRRLASRHRSLRSVVEWSYRRLTELEQRSLERLSVFVGAFDLAAARALLRDVVGDQHVVRHLVQLVARSLLTFEAVRRPQPLSHAADGPRATASSGSVSAASSRRRSGATPSGPSPSPQQRTAISWPTSGRR